MKALIKALFRVMVIIYFVGSLDTSLRLIGREIALYRNTGYAPIMLIAVLIAFIVNCALLFLLWRKTDSIINFITGPIDESYLVISTSNDALIQIPIYLLGIYILAISVPELLGLIGTRFYYNMYPNIHDPFAGPAAQTENVRLIITEVLKLLVGIWLATGGLGLKRILMGIWNFGQGINTTSHLKNNLLY